MKLLSEVISNLNKTKALSSFKFVSCVGYNGNTNEEIIDDSINLDNYKVSILVFTHGLTAVLIQIRPGVDNYLKYEIMEFDNGTLIPLSLKQNTSNLTIEKLDKYITEDLTLFSAKIEEQNKKEKRLNLGISNLSATKGVLLYNTSIPTSAISPLESTNYRQLYAELYNNLLDTDLNKVISRIYEAFGELIKAIEIEATSIISKNTHIKMMEIISPFALTKTQIEVLNLVNSIGEARVLNLLKALKSE